jgi:hypothetical protein
MISNLRRGGDAEGLPAFRACGHSGSEGVSSHPPGQRILFLRAWNEWAEGNYMEPDEECGLGRLQALKRALDAFNTRDVRTDQPNGLR